MSQVIRISGQLEQLAVKNIEHVGEEGARRGAAVLPDGSAVPVYNHPENGTIWYEQMSMNEWLASQVEEDEDE
jgi:hypothetical protein